jgi:hypothetical protein
MLFVTICGYEFKSVVVTEYINLTNWIIIYSEELVDIRYEVTRNKTHYSFISVMICAFYFCGLIKAKEVWYKVYILW